MKQYEKAFLSFASCLKVPSFNEYGLPTSKRYAFDKILFLDMLIQAMQACINYPERTSLKKYSALHFTDPATLNQLKYKELGWVQMAKAMVRDTEVKVNRLKADV
mmetsp:Transcript_27020/g.41159  ORF Transcript_27020/g.41159 Transcript_27020/m.41159 type:complete len:105 (-) Transcript_27020:876-1190(-)